MERLFEMNVIAVPLPISTKNLLIYNLIFVKHFVVKRAKIIEDRAIEEITSSELAEIMGKVFVSKHFSKEAKMKVNEMVDNLLTVFQGRINNLD